MVEINKNILRAELKTLRRSMSKSEIYSKSRQICRFTLEKTQSFSCIMAYLSAFNEVNVDFLIENLILENKKVCVPITDAQSSIISPSYISSLTTGLKQGAYGIREPELIKPVPKNDIDLVIVPGIGFDKNFNRLGFGKGCYDRFLNGLDAIKIGVCYEFQIRDTVFADDFDIPMDIIITENGVLKK